VANRLRLHRKGAVGFIDWLGGSARTMDAGVVSGDSSASEVFSV
jgi:hypothetical protein